MFNATVYTHTKQAIRLWKGDTATKKSCLVSLCDSVSDMKKVAGEVSTVYEAYPHMAGVYIWEYGETNLSTLEWGDEMKHIFARATWNFLCWDFYRFKLPSLTWNGILTRKDACTHKIFVILLYTCLYSLFSSLHNPTKFECVRCIFEFDLHFSTSTLSLKLEAFFLTLILKKKFDFFNFFFVSYTAEFVKIPHSFASKWTSNCPQK